MPSYDKLPSGKWRGRMQIDGKRVSVTADTKRECAALLERRHRIKRGDITVGEAISTYIETREAVFSPATVRGYLAYQRNYFLDLQRRPIAFIDERDVAKAVNEEAKKHSPKTVRNAYGLLHAAISPYISTDGWNIRLPQKRKKEPYIPTEQEVKDLIAAVAGTKYELPFQLAAYCGLRRSEICALTYDDIKDGYVSVSKALVCDCNNKFQEKAPKTYAGYRRVKLPKNVKIEGEGGMPIVTVSPHALTQKCRKASGYKFSIHDLRHFYASVLLLMGIPNKYAAKQMGHSGDGMLQKVYQHLFPNAVSDYDEAISEKFSEL